MVAVAFLALTPSPATATDIDDENPARVMTMLGDGGQHLLVTGHQMHAGDQFIDPGNDLWQVGRIDGRIAIATRVAKLVRSLTPGERSLLRRPAAVVLAETVRQAAPARAPEPPNVVIYHTHSDESYIPGDGSDSIPGRGGIYAVGSSMAAALERAGITAVQRQESHYPHDNRAYMRSRRTAMDALMRQRPDAEFDVHRDGAPAAHYKLVLGGRQVSRVMIVIGGANPARGGNLAFARLLKGHADALYPGLMRGIYIGGGTYNQDIYSRNILLEVGSQGTPRADAERGAALIAAAVAPALREAGPGRIAENRSAWWNIIVLLLATLLVGAAVLVVVTARKRL